MWVEVDVVVNRVADASVRPAAASVEFVVKMEVVVVVMVELIVVIVSWRWW